MDPLQPIVPHPPVISPITPAPPSGRVDRDAGRRRRDGDGRQTAKRRAPEPEVITDGEVAEFWSSDEDDETPHIDVTA